MRHRLDWENESSPQVRRPAAARRSAGVAVAALTAVVLFIVGAVPAWAITVTFVRHGQSAGNASGFIDTSVPGPVLTEQGHNEAEAIAETLKNNGYDAIYASNMIRTQQTAAPLADALNLDVTVLPGFREISAGIFEGSSEKEGLGRIGYALPPMAWMLGLRSIPIPGSTTGNAFDARVDDALQTVYDSGAQKPVVFAHGATIMFWVMMNVDNPDLSLFFQHPLGNTAVVVVNGSPEQGWTLESWDGIEVGEASLPTKLFVNVRDLITAPQTSIYRVVQALESRDPAAIAAAIRDGIVEIATAPVKFVAAVTRDIIDAVHGGISQPHVAVAPSPAALAKSTATPAAIEATDDKTGIKAVAEVSGQAATEPDATGDQDLADGKKTRSAKADSREGKAKQALRDARDRVKTSQRDARADAKTAGGKTAHDAGDTSAPETTSTDSGSDTSDRQAA